MKIPVIANGDIFSGDDAISMMSETGADGVMIARGALGNPWIFEEIRALIENREYATPSVAQRISTALLQFEDMILKKGDRVGLAEAKKHMAWYTKGMHGSAEIRAKIMNASSADEVASFLRSLIRGE